MRHLRPFPPDGTEDSVDEARRLRSAQLLRRLDRLVDRDLVGDVVAMQKLEQRDAQDAPLERRDAVERPALRVTRDQRVELAARAIGPLDERARERSRAGRYELSERPSGHLPLIE